MEEKPGGAGRTRPPDVPRRTQFNAVRDPRSMILSCKAAPPRAQTKRADTNLEQTRGLCKCDAVRSLAIQTVFLVSAPLTRSRSEVDKLLRLPLTEMNDHDRATRNRQGASQETEQTTSSTLHGRQLN
jgi:hypothetical protein